MKSPTDKPLGFVIMQVPVEYAAVLVPVDLYAIVILFTR
jgi:hypothetical protein